MDFTVLTYNIHKAIGNDRLYDIQRVLNVCRDINADFIALQEVDQGVPRSRYDDQAKIISEELGLNYVLGLNVKLKKGSYGNAIFTRYPIKEHTNINLTWTIKKPRACLAARIELPTTDLIFMNFHLGLAGIERMKQIKMLLGSPFIKDHRDLPIILLGDSNDRAHRLNPVLSKAGYEDTCKNTRINTFPSYAPVLRLDKIYYNDRLKIKEHHVIQNKLTRVASDHLPVFSRLKLSL